MQCVSWGLWHGGEKGGFEATTYVVSDLPDLQQRHKDNKGFLGNQAERSDAQMLVQEVDGGNPSESGNTRAEPH